MNFWKRLRFYGIGFGIGLLMVYAMFGTRSCVMPNEMKMQELVFQHFDLSEKAKCKLRCIKRNEMLLKVELRHFEVDYSLSSPRKEPCGEYYVKSKKEFEDQHPFELVMIDCDTITKIKDIQIHGSANTCTCQ